MILGAIIDTFGIPFAVRSFSKNGSAWTTAAVFVLNLSFSMVLEIYFSHALPKLNKVLGCMICFVGVYFITVEKNLNE